jgi:hypothetical protein
MPTQVKRIDQSVRTPLNHVITRNEDMEKMIGAGGGSDELAQSGVCLDGKPAPNDDRLASCPRPMLLEINATTHRAPLQDALLPPTSPLYPPSITRSFPCISRNYLEPHPLEAVARQTHDNISKPTKLTETDIKSAKDTGYSVTNLRPWAKFLGNFPPSHSHRDDSRAGTEVGSRPSDLNVGLGFTELFLVGHPIASQQSCDSEVFI